MKVFVLFSLLVVGISAVPILEPRVRYDNYKVYRFVPKNEAEVELLSSLENDFPGLLYWKRVGKVGRPVDIMIPPHLQPEILSGLQTTTMEVTEPWIEDVQKLIDEEEAANKAGLAKSKRLSWEAYYDYQDILDFLDEQVALHPNVASLQTYGKSFEGRDLKVIKISTGGNGQRPIIFLDANIHAREWITNAVATYVINELLNGQASGLRGILNTFDVHVAPVLNPDGYTYTRNSDRVPTMLAHSAEELIPTGTGDTCGTPVVPALSALPRLTEVSMLSLNLRLNLSLTTWTPSSPALQPTLACTTCQATLNYYSQLVLIPYGTNVNGSPRIPDHENHMRVGRLVENAIARRYNTRFTTGNIVEILYVASGASVDWMKGVHDTRLAYTFELRDTGRYGFLLPPDQIIPSSLEFIDGLIVLANDLKVQLASAK